MLKKILWLGLLLFSLSSIAFSQQARVLSGPMNGYAEHRECMVWIQTTCARQVTLQWKNELNPSQKGTVVHDIPKEAGCTPSISKLILTGLTPGQTYSYKIWLDQKEISSPVTLKCHTKPLWEWRSAPPAFSFIMGSCNYINDSAFDRPGKPYGQSTSILHHMAASPAQMMLWLGDNVYLREADYSSVSGIQYRYQHTRSHPDLQKLLATKQHYAITDDHDFGPNNSCKNFGLAEASAEIFKSYWGNKYYGKNGKGLYSLMSYSDCDFFLLDNRSQRDEDLLPDSIYAKTQLGKEQLDWLLQSLLASRATFKFIVMGGQFLNTFTREESYVQFSRERQVISDFIQKHRLNGIVFISGDRHHSEILKRPIPMDSVTQKPAIRERRGDRKKDPKKTAREEDEEETATPPKAPILYEITCSPLTSGSSNILKTPEAQNPMRVPHTLVTEQNYCQVTVGGPEKNRNLLIKCFNGQNELKWEFTIREEDLKWNP